MICSDRETKRREQHKAARLRAWERTGSLYSTRAEEHLTQRIRDAFAVEFGPLRESTDVPVDVMEAGEVSAARAGDAGYAAMTLEAVGHALGITREAVRQIEVKALAKMAQALKLLAKMEGHRRGEAVIEALLLRTRKRAAR
jgi:phage terminase large subunit-like protein